MLMPMTADALSVFHPLTVDLHGEGRDTTQYQVWGGVRPIFIVVSDVPKRFNVLASRRGITLSPCVYTFCARFNIVSEEPDFVALWLRNCMMQMFNVLLRPWMENVVPDDHGCLTSSPTVLGA